MTPRIPLWKQLLGALVGGIVAVSIYGMYEYTSPYVASLFADVTEAEEHVEVVVKSEGEKWDDVAALARQILEDKSGK